MDYRVRGFTRNVRGMKHLSIDSIRNFISPNALLQTDPLERPREEGSGVSVDFAFAWKAMSARHGYALRTKVAAPIFS
jgi:hypothetical protein